MVDLLHALVIRARPERVYDALTVQQHLSTWFAPGARVGSLPGDTLEFPFGAHTMCFTLLVRKPPSFISWRLVRGMPGWEDLDAEVSFSLAVATRGTRLYFRMSGWPALDETYAGVNYTWATFLTSLKTYCEST